LLRYLIHICVDKKLTKRQKFKNQTILDRRTKLRKEILRNVRNVNFFFILDLFSYCVCYYLTCGYTHFKFFNAKPTKCPCVMKLCVPLQFADTIIVNICTQLVRRAWLYYAGLEVCRRCILQESPANAKGTRDSSACMKAHCEQM